MRKNLQHKEHISVVMFEIDTESGHWGAAPAKRPGPAIKRCIVERAQIVRWGGAEPPEGCMRFRLHGHGRKIGGVIRLDKEDIEWARGWKTEAARALHAAAALS